MSTQRPVRVLVTGADGFIGKNLVQRLREDTAYDVSTLVRSNAQEVRDAVRFSEVVIHLAGENRPKDSSAFVTTNVELTRVVCDTIRESEHKPALLLASSTQAIQDSAYGRSKLAAEELAERLAAVSGASVSIYRLPGVFGKWCRPNYNSVVATFCHNIANELPIEVHDPQRPLNLVYVDDVVEGFLAALRCDDVGLRRRSISPEYAITLGDLAEQIRAFHDSRRTLVTERVGTGITRALYATYLSYLPPARFAYTIPEYCDERGTFVEFLKTADSGQFSFFTAGPGVTRGGHYHHTKTEKFLVLQGEARFGFRHIVTGEVHEIRTSRRQPTIVETIPGWTHDITNVGEGEMIVMLWANEIFNRAKPDTVACKV